MNLTTTVNQKQLLDILLNVGLVRPVFIWGTVGIGKSSIVEQFAELVGLPTVPCIVRELTDDEAIIVMVDSNLQREQVLPSEKAFAYKMKLDAMKRQGECTDLTFGPVGAVDKPYPIFKLRDKIEEKTGWDGYADTDRR